jgi:hypothetical protein
MEISKKSLVHKNNELKIIDSEGPNPPNRKDLLNNLLSSLGDAKSHYENKYLSYDKSNIPKEFLDIFLGLKNEVEDFLDRYEMIESYTLPGKTQGRNINTAAREIALKVTKDYQSMVDDPDAIPTGEYLFEKVNETINALALKGEPCPMDVKLRTCQSWTKEMRDGVFEKHLK